MTGSTIAGLGFAVPDHRLTNADLEAVLDTSDSWIVERTGIHERRIAGPLDSTASLATAAGASAIKDAGLVPGDIAMVMVATATPDQPLPGVAAFVHESLGLGGGAFDIGAACAGFVYGLILAGNLASATGPVLVIGAETLSRVVDPADRGTRILFGDGAGAAVVSTSDSGTGLLAFDTGCDGSAAGHLAIRAAGGFIEMDGAEVFRRAVRVTVASAEAALARAGLPAAAVDRFVPHQANARIIDAVAGRLGIPAERTSVNIDRYGNTSAASIPIALAEDPPAAGDLVLLAGFGAGMTWATAVLRWGDS